MITAASEDARSNAVDQADLQDWATYFGITFPVLADTGAAVDRLYDPLMRTRPTYVLLAPGGEIISAGTTVTDADIEAVLPTPYP